MDTALPAEYIVPFGALFFFFRVLFFRGQLPETSCFRLAKQKLVASFASHAMARNLSELL